MKRKCGLVMTLCPKCRSIQKADSICTICKYPIPAKEPQEGEELSASKLQPPEDPQEKKEARSTLVLALERLAQYRRFDEMVDEEDEENEEVAPVPGAAKRPRISKPERIAINMQLNRAGFDGNGRFESPSEALTLAMDVLGRNGIEQDSLPSSWALTKYDDFSLTVHLAWSNPDDPFSPIPIHHNMLIFTWYKFVETGLYEALAYVS